MKIRSELATVLAVAACLTGCPDTNEPFCQTDTVDVSCGAGTVCCRGECIPDGRDCACANGDECPRDQVCCDEGPNAGTCSTRAECAPACTSIIDCASNGEVCCQTGANAGMCVPDGDCPCETSADCADISIDPWECCAGSCIPAGSACEDAGPSDQDAGPPGADAGPPSDDGGGPPGCGTYSNTVDTAAEIIRSCIFDGAPAICSGGAAGQLRVLDAATGAQLEARDVAAGSRVYSCESFPDDADPTLVNYLCNADDGAVRIDRQTGTWSFVQRLYGINTPNVTQFAFLLNLGQILRFVMLDSAARRVDLAEKDGFGSWARTRQATIPSSGPLAGVACIPDTELCVVAADANPGEYFVIDWSVADGMPGHVVSLGTAGSSPRNGTCTAGLCAFADFGGGGVSLFNATTSPPTFVETRAIGPEPLAVSAATVGGVAALVTMTSDDTVHVITGSAAALSFASYAAPGTCAATGPRTAVIFGSDCVAASCPDSAAPSVRGGPLPAPD